ncbi:MAG TPA: hypothetical protein VGT03_14080 [Candidatus Acidoferrales bacterium]|nr:hypothetical protein [Candidatus Acidoferrales bacterium]
MIKRFMIIFGLLLALIGGTLWMPRQAAAQEQSNYTYVSEWAAPRAQWPEFDKQDAASVPNLKKLVADGTLIAWGNLTIRVHQEDGYTHAEWFTATSRAALLKALDSQWTTAVNPAYASATKHRDFLFHTIAHGGKTASLTDGYLRVGAYAAKPGEGPSFVEHFMKYFKPVLDADIADGSLVMYNFDEEDIHTLPPGAYNIALLFPNGEAIDKFYAALEASSKDNPAALEMLNALTRGSEHRDLFGRVTAYQHK